MKELKSTLVLAATLLTALPVASLSGADDRTLLLENAQLSLSISPRTAGIMEISNKASGETYRVEDRGFLVELGEEKRPGTLGRITPADSTVGEVSVDGGEAKIVFSRGPARITVSYRLDPEDSFAVKRVRVEYAGEGSFNVSRLDMFDWDLWPRPFRSIPYHGFLSQRVNVPFGDRNVGTPTNSTAFFMRYEKGGIFTAVSCDYVYMHQEEESGRCRSVYWPGQIRESGEAFESEMGLIGVYRREGFFHKPYSTTAHLGNEFLKPNVDVRLDRAEIEGMRNAVQKFLKPEPYTFVANGWAMGLPSKINTPEAVEQYKRAIDVSQTFPGVEGIHFIDNFGGLSEEFGEHGLNSPYELNPHIREAFDYAEEKGMGLSGFVWVSRGQPAPDLPELLVLDHKGERRARSLAFTREYSDFILDTFSRHAAEYPHFMGLSFDFLYLYPDYDPDHGYLPGIGSLYAQWANARDTLRRLRQQHPDWMLRTQIGWRQHGPWMAEHSSFVHNSMDPNISVQRNFLDFHASYQYANNLRLTSWFAANCKMFPRYMMNSFLVHKNVDYDAWDYGAWRYCVLSRIAAGSGFGMLNGKPGLEGGELFPDDQKEFLAKWMNWQRERKDYYVRAASLFGEPRPTGVDGMAYGNGSDSFVFLCNPTFETQQVALPVSGDIHLPQGGRYTIKELYPEERYRIGLDDGTFGYGSTFIVDVPAQTVAVFEVKPLQAERPYLLGIAGEIERSGDTWAIREVSGPTGLARQFAVRLPESDEAISRVTVDGQDFPTKRNGQMLLGQIKFAGEAIDPEISGWSVQTDGGKTVLRADFFVPESARGVLEQQALPVTEKYRDQEEILNTTAWLDWSRFIIHIPVLPEGAVPEEEPFLLESPTLEEHEEAVAALRPAASLNDETVEVRSNFMRSVERSSKRKRWSGFFIDASGSIKYGKKNTLTLEFPGQTQRGYFAAYMPNLTPQRTREWEIRAPLEELLVEASPGAQEAYPGIPVLTEGPTGVTVYLKVSIAGRGAADFTGEQVAVEKGELGRVTLLDPKRGATNGGRTLMQLSDGLDGACVRFQVHGANDTRIRLLGGGSADGDELGSFTLEELLAAWRQRGDAFETLALEVPGVRGVESITVELVGPPSEKLAVRDAL